MSYKYLDAATLKGETITKIEQKGGDEIHFRTESGKMFRMFHYQDCCENVRIHDIKGNLQSLVGWPLRVAKEETSTEWPSDVPKPEYGESFTWTIYTFEALLEAVVIRWLGESNGYYSEAVQIEELTAQGRIFD